MKISIFYKIVWWENFYRFTRLQAHLKSVSLDPRHNFNFWTPVKSFQTWFLCFQNNIKIMLINDSQEAADSNYTNSTESLEDFEEFDLRDALNVAAYSVLTTGRRTKSCCFYVTAILSWYISMKLSELRLVAKIRPSFNSNFSWGWVSCVISLSSRPPTYHPPTQKIMKWQL